MPKSRNSFRDRWTNHMSSREQQRGIRRETIVLAEKYGAIDGDKYILSKKQMLSVLKELDQVRKNLLRGIDQGGIIAVQAESGDWITTYRVDSYKRGLA